MLNVGSAVCSTGPWFNIKMSSYQYRKSHCGDKTVARSSYLHNGISYTGKMTSLYWTNPLVSEGTALISNEILPCCWLCDILTQYTVAKSFCSWNGLSFIWHINSNLAPVGTKWKNLIRIHMRNILFSNVGSHLSTKKYRWVNARKNKLDT